MARWDNDKQTDKITEAARGKLRGLDAGDAANGSGYTAQTWANNKNEGEVGPHVTAWLNTLEAALANSSAHYTHVPLSRGKNCWLDESLIMKLNAISTHVASLRP